MLGVFEPSSFQSRTYPRKVSDPYGGRKETKTLSNLTVHPAGAELVRGVCCASGWGKQHVVVGGEGAMGTADDGELGRGAVFEFHHS